MKKERGFQLIELFLVLAIVGLSGTIAVGVWNRLADHYRLQEGSRRLTALLRSARTLALAGAAPIEVVPHQEARAFSLRIGPDPPRRWLWLPEGVQLSLSPRRPLRFFSRGQAAPAGRYRLEGRFNSIDVVVAPWGRVRQGYLEEDE